MLKFDIRQVTKAENNRTVASYKEEDTFRSSFIDKRSPRSPQQVAPRAWFGRFFTSDDFCDATSVRCSMFQFSCWYSDLNK